MSAVVQNQPRPLTRDEHIKRLLAPAHKQIKALCANDEKRASQFTAAALLVATNYKLNNCSPESIVQALLSIATTGLSVDPNFGHAYLVPYKGHVQLQLGYKGYIQLAYRAGWIIKSFPVYDVDTYTESSDGWDDKIVFIKNYSARNEGNEKWVFEHLVGVRVAARHVDTKDEYSLFIPKSVIEKLRNLSPNQKDVNNPTDIWANNYLDMAQAKAIKLLAKKLPLGDKRMIDIDDKVIDSSHSVEVPTPQPVNQSPVQPQQSHSDFDNIEDGDFTNVPDNVDVTTGEIINPDPMPEAEQVDTPEAATAIEHPVFKGERYVAGSISNCQTNNALVAFWETVPPEIQVKFQAKFEEKQDLLRFA